MSSLIFESTTVSKKFNPQNATERNQRKRIFPDRWKHSDNTFYDSDAPKKQVTTYKQEYLNFTPNKMEPAGRLSKREDESLPGKKHFDSSEDSPITAGNLLSYVPSPEKRKGKKLFYEKSDPILQGGDRYKPEFRPMCKQYKKKRMKELKGDESDKISRKKILASKVNDHDDIVKYKFASPRNRLENAFNEIGDERKKYENMMYGMVEDLHYENAHKYHYYKTRKNAKSMIFEDPLYNRKPTEE